MLNIILPFVQNNAKFRGIIEHAFNQPVEHVFGCVGAFMENVRKGPGLANTEEQKLTLFNRIYQGGRAMGFADWEAEYAAAKLAGYSDMDICINFRERHRWPQTTIEDIAAIEPHVMPRFLEKAKKSGLLPPEMFPEAGLPATDVTTSGGSAPWEHLKHSGAGASGETKTAPQT